MEEEQVTFPQVSHVLDIENIDLEHFPWRTILKGFYKMHQPDRAPTPSNW